VERNLKNRLKLLREERCLTQKEVAKLLDTTSPAVSRHESNSRGLTKDMVEAYAKLYKVSSVELFLNLPTEADGEVGLLLIEEETPQE